MTGRRTVEQARAAWPNLDWTARHATLEGRYYDSRFSVWVSIDGPLIVAAYAGDACVLDHTICQNLDEALGLAYRAWMQFPHSLPMPRSVEVGGLQDALRQLASIADAYDQGRLAGQAAWAGNDPHEVVVAQTNDATPLLTLAACQMARAGLIGPAPLSLRLATALIDYLGADQEPVLVHGSVSKTYVFQFGAWREPDAGSVHPPVVTEYPATSSSSKAVARNELRLFAQEVIAVYQKWAGHSAQSPTATRAGEQE